MIEEIQLLVNSLAIKVDDNCIFARLTKTGRSVIVLITSYPDLLGNTRIEARMMLVTF